MFFCLSLKTFRDALDRKKRIVGWMCEDNKENLSINIMKSKYPTCCDDIVYWAVSTCASLFTLPFPYFEIAVRRGFL